MFHSSQRPSPKFPKKKQKKEPFFFCSRTSTRLERSLNQFPLVFAIKILLRNGREKVFVILCHTKQPQKKKTFTSIFFATYNETKRATCVCVYSSNKETFLFHCFLFFLYPSKQASQASQAFFPFFFPFPSTRDRDLHLSSSFSFTFLGLLRPSFRKFRLKELPSPKYGKKPQFQTWSQIQSR